MRDSADGMWTGPVRTIVAAVVMFIAGWGVARAITVLLAEISAPSLGRFVLPARFSYGLPAGLQGSTWWIWLLVVLGFIATPLCVNGAWLSRRIVSLPGALKLLAAACLLALSAVAMFVGADAVNALAIADGG